MTEQQRRPRILLIILFVLGGTVLLCGLYAGGLYYAVVRVTAAPAEATRTFLTAVGNQEYEQAFNMLSPGLQAEFDTAVGFAEAMQSRRIAPDELVRITNRAVDDDNVATIVGPVTFKDGALQTVTANLRFDPERGAWLVTGFRFE